jgi:hypothetical protein
MGLFGNAEERAARKAEKRAAKAAARAERVDKRREFLSGVIDKGAGIAGMFATGGGGAAQPATREEPYSGSLGSAGMPKWVLPVAAGAALLFFMSKKGGRR